MAAHVHTSDLSAPNHVAARIQAGTIWVNCDQVGVADGLPFGGFEKSS